MLFTDNTSQVKILSYILLPLVMTLDRNGIYFLDMPSNKNYSILSALKSAMIQPGIASVKVKYFLRFNIVLVTASYLSQAFHSCRKAASTD